MNPSREKFPVPEISAHPTGNEIAPIELQASQEGLYAGERKDQTHELRKNPFSMSGQQVISTNQQVAHNPPSGQTYAPTINSVDEIVSEAIERESVAKAKAIIASTQNDPHEESNKIGALKIDYLQKKYGKQLKMSDQ